jgi:hypothetical protein
VQLLTELGVLPLVVTQELLQSADGTAGGYSDLFYILLRFKSESRPRQ